MHNQGYSVEEQSNRIQKMRLNVFFVILSCMARLVFMYFFFEPISFTISLFISIFGTMASLKKLKTCLSIYGYITLIQAIASYCFIIYFAMKNPQPIWMFGLYSLFILILSVGASSSFSLRNQILNYENYFGDIRRYNLKKKTSNDMDLQMVKIEDHQISTENINNNNNNINNNNIYHHNLQNNNIYNNNNNFIPQHFIPSVYSPNKFPQQQPHLSSSLSPQGNNNINNNNNNNFAQQPISPPPQFHIHFSQQIPSASPSTIYKSPQFAPQVITTQRNVPKRTVIYHI